MGPSDLGGNNYARSSARTTHLSNQIASFSGDHGGSADPDALYVIWAGTVDALQGLSVTDAAGNVAASISSLAGLGAQFFLVPNLFDIGTMPARSASNRQLSIDFNSALVSALAGLSNVTLFEPDFFSFVDSVMANPGAFGFTDVTTSCYYSACANPDQFFYWDNIHPSSQAHAVLAAEALYSVPEPATSLALLAGVGLLAGLARLRGVPLVP
jgi:phospholipase/lecithinase/hemolysin